MIAAEGLSVDLVGVAPAESHRADHADAARDGVPAAEWTLLLLGDARSRLHREGVLGHFLFSIISTTGADNVALHLAQKIIKTTTTPMLKVLPRGTKGSHVQKGQMGCSPFAASSWVGRRKIGSLKASPLVFKVLP